MYYLKKLKYLLFFILAFLLSIILSILCFFIFFPIGINQASFKSLNNIIKTSNTKFSKQLWFEYEIANYTRLTIYNDLHDNYLTKDFKYDQIEDFLGKPYYNRIYDTWFYQRTCKQYFLGKEISFGVVVMYMIICPDKNYEYVEDVYLLSSRSFTPSFDFGIEENIER